MKSIEEQLFEIVQQSPDKVALISGETEVTYSQFGDYCLRAAYKLQNTYHLKKGDCVILSAAGNIEFVYVYFGVHLAGGICVPIDPDTNQTRFNHIKTSTKPICVMGMLHNVTCEAIDFSDVIDGTEKAEFVAPVMDEIADVLFTTGTTGVPKGVALSYLNLAAAARNINEFIGNTADDVELLALPVSHSFGLGRLRCSLTKGATVVMLGTFANVKKFFNEMKRCNVTMFAMVPASWGFLKKMSGKYIGKFADQLKFIEIGSSFMPKEEKEFLMEQLPHTRICMHYGSTEASRSAFMEFRAYKDNLLSAGKASPHTEIKIFSSEGKPLPFGEEGEICVKGPNVMLGYYNNPEATAEVFDKDGFFHTGDYGKLDEEGWIYITGRKKNLIILSNGKNVYPEEIEADLQKVEGVTEVVVYAGESRVQKDKITIVAEIFPDADLLKDKGITDMQKYFEDQVKTLNAKMPPYKAVKCVKLRDVEFQKNTSRKITRFSIDKTID